MTRQLSQSISKMTRPLSKREALSNESCFLLHTVDGWAISVVYLGKRWNQDALWEGGKLVEAVWLSRQMFSWETLGSGIHLDVTLTCTTCLNNVAGQVLSFMVTVFPHGCGLSQQDSEPCQSTKIIQEWFEEQVKELKELPWPPDSLDLNLIKHLRDVWDKQVSVHGGPTS